MNNVVPNLPPHVAIHWSYDELPEGLLLLLRNRSHVNRRPYIVIIDSLTPSAISLRDALAPLKKFAKRDRQTASKAGAAIRSVGIPGFSAVSPASS